MGTRKLIYSFIQEIKLFSDFLPDTRQAWGYSTEHALEVNCTEGGDWVTVGLYNELLCWNLEEEDGLEGSYSLRRRYEVLNLRGGGVNGKERETVKAD